ncbi:MAG: ABC transporter ATP-binding protein [Candidatus Rokubacteria bacterium]|nr:ABC transporter ATP-binding protein [Candidatus Rokubacteria bacterium]
MKITICEVTKRFGALEAVSQVSLDIGEGELFTLLGPSGCGKTTLLRLIAGFYRPDDGTIAFDGREMNAVPPYERRIGMVFQNYALWPHMTVWHNVAYGLRIKKLPRAEIAARVQEVLRKVNLGGLDSRYPGQLSGGQQQRVALARALVLNPDILLLDEPLSNLDAKIRVQVRAEIRKLQKELGITTIYVTHDQEEALSLSDRIAVMDGGKVLQVGLPKELYERPRTRFVADFIGTNNLLEGTVRTRDSGAGRVAVETAIGVVEGFAVSDLPPGSRCTVSVRPENARLAPAWPAERNWLRGRITFSAYLGSILRYDVEAEGGFIFKVDITDPWHHQALDLGKEVVVTFPSSGTLVIPA